MFHDDDSFLVGGVNLTRTEWRPRKAAILSRLARWMRRLNPDIQEALCKLHREGLITLHTTRISYHLRLLVKHQGVATI
jgi:hypothetical protein